MWSCHEKACKKVRQVAHSSNNYRQQLNQKPSRSAARNSNAGKLRNCNDADCQRSARPDRAGLEGFGSAFRGGSAGHNLPDTTGAAHRALLPTRRLDRTAVFRRVCPNGLLCCGTSKLPASEDGPLRARSMGRATSPDALTGNQPLGGILQPSRTCIAYRGTGHRNPPELPSGGFH